MTRYADRDAVIVADWAEGIDELEPRPGTEVWPGTRASILPLGAPGHRRLGEQIRAAGESGAFDDLSAAVIALDAVDRCFREAGLWPGDIYLVGAGKLAVVLGQVEGAGQPIGSEPEAVLRELAALELVYLFPVAGKFRSGAYDGQVQYRLNGWGRALGQRLTATAGGAVRAAACQAAIGRHLAGEYQRYASFLAGLDVARQDYCGDRLDPALALPIPVLV